MNNIFKIGDKAIKGNDPTYFVADIAANHDGDIERAKDLIYKAAESGANAAKFQHFSASTIVSDIGFRSLVNIGGHQKAWNKSVYEVYKEASIHVDWTPTLADTCKKAGITFFTSPYSIELVNEVDRYVAAYKIGSGDITWHKLIEHVARKNKPYILATGAASIAEVQMAVDLALGFNKNMALMQCNTNYTASLENFKHINLNVLKVYGSMYPELILGLSDHTPGHATVLGAICLGAKIIEKHFTDSQHRNGPDHLFSMDPRTWKEMVDRSRELELSLGSGNKKVEDNELETVILQRRAIRFKGNVKANTTLSVDDLIELRPCPRDAIPPYKLKDILGKTIKNDKYEGDYLKWTDIM